MPHLFRRPAFMSAVAAAALSLAGCGGGSSEAPQAQIEAVEIGAIAPKRESLTEPVVATGTIAAAKTTDVGPSVDGIIEEVYVKVGDRVEAGSRCSRPATSSTGFKSSKRSRTSRSPRPRPRTRVASTSGPRS